MSATETDVVAAATRIVQTEDRRLTPTGYTPRPPAARHAIPCARCGHPRDFHIHHHPRRYCGSCNCNAWQRPGRTAAIIRRLTARGDHQ